MERHSDAGCLTADERRFVTTRSITSADVDRDILRVVALAYLERRRAGYSDLQAFEAALAVYQGCCPDVPEDRAAEVVGQLIGAAISGGVFRRDADHQQ